MAYKYDIHIWWSEKYGHYLAKVPDLPGCMADGKTMEELVKELEIVQDMWADEGEEMPVPQHSDFMKELIKGYE